MEKVSLKELANRWPSTFVARSEIKAFTGGAISEKSMANLDSQKLGPKGRIRLGKKVLYEIAPLITWLEERAERLN